MPNRRRLSLALAILLAGSLPLYAHPGGASKDTFELVGQLEASDPRMFRNTYASVSLQGVSLAYSTRTLSDSKGRFKFKGLPAGMYILVAALPRVSVLRRTIDVGPSFADEKRRVHLSIPFGGQPIRRANTVSSDQLAIPDEARREHQRALEFSARGETERATDLLLKVVENAPQYVQAWNSLGNISLQAEKLEEAELYFREALNRNPNYYRVLIALGGTLISMGKPGESLEIYLRAVKARPEDPDGLAGLGVSYLQLGQFEKAEQNLLEVKRIEPGHYSCPQLALAQIYATREMTARAIQELDEFLKLHPDSEFVPSVLESLKILRKGSE